MKLRHLLGGIVSVDDEVGKLLLESGQFGPVEAPKPPSPPRRTRKPTKSEAAQ
jgi:hypothetical protein